MNKDIEKLAEIAKELISSGNKVIDRNGLPYCKNCGIDLIDMGNTIGIIAEKLKNKIDSMKGTAL